MITKDEATVGAQIAYIPTHADGDITHPDVEFGFITSLHPDVPAAYCRYLSKTHAGLRTLSNSELTSFDNLVLYVSHTEDEVESDVQKILKAT